MVPSAKGISQKIATELGDLDGHGQTAGDQAATGFMGKFRSGISGVGAAIGGAFLAAGIAGIVKGSIDAASGLNETMSKTGVVFGDSTDQVVDFADNAESAFGQSKKQALDAASTFALFGKSAGLTGTDLAGFSTNLVGLSSDFASFFDTSPEEAIEAIGAALRGENEPIRKYGILLDDATLRSQALKMGLISTTKEALTPQQKVLAAQAAIMEKSTDAQGDFARTADTAANKQRELSAKTANLSAELGTALLPIYTKIVSVLAEKVVPTITKLSEWLGEHKGVATAAAVVIGGVLVAAFVAWAISAAAAAVATLAAAAPFIAIGLAVAALAAGIIWAYQNIDIFRTIIDTVWQVLQAVFNWVSANWPLLLAILLGPFGVAILVVVKNFDAIKAAAVAVWDWVSANWPLLLAILTGPIGIAVLAIVKNWDTITNGFTAVKDWISQKIDNIVSFLTGLPGRVGATISNFWESIKQGFTAVETWLSQKIDNIVSFFVNMPGRLTHAFGGMFDGISNAFRSAINVVIDGWNRLEFGIPGFNVGPVSFGGVTIGTPNIPRLAAGGVVSSATLALIGERGPEIVAPQSAIRDAVAEALAGFRGAGNVTVNALTNANAYDIAREVSWLQRTSGR